MSMPVIPDICPEISITREDAINLLLTSIALEEFELADLIEAEKKKILFILGEDAYDEPSTKDILKINHSVNQTVKNIIKLQMLLQFKLENVMELAGVETCCVPCTTTCSTTCTSTHTTTCTTTSHRTTSCTTTKCTPKEQKPCPHQEDKEAQGLLAGHAQGGIINTMDTFFGGTAFLKFDLYEDPHRRRINSIRYYAEKGRIMETFTAIPDSIVIMRNGEQKNIYEICGIGTLCKTSHEQPDGTANGTFTLTIWTADGGRSIVGFRMGMTSEKCRELNHDSGMVSLNGAALVTGE